MAIILTLTIFTLDALSPLQGAVALLYTLVILTFARSHDRGLLVAVGTLGVAIAIAAYGVSHGSEPLGSPAIRLEVSLVAIDVTTGLRLRNAAVLRDRLRSDTRYRTNFNAAGLAIWEGD